MFKQNNYQNFITIISFFLLVLLSNQLLSQTRYTVLLPELDKAIPRDSADSLQIAADNDGKETAKSFFKFNFKQMPLNAEVKSLNLKMYNFIDSNWDRFFKHPITVLKGTNGWSGNETSLGDRALSWADIRNNRPIGIYELTRSSTSITVNLNMSVALPETDDGILSLAARSPAKNKDTKFHSSITAESSDDFSKKPKLIASYEVDGYPFRADWAQPFSTAQHTSYLNWRTNTTTKEAKIQILPITGGYSIQDIVSTGAVAIYKNQPIIFTQSVSGTREVYHVKQLDAKGTVIWSQGVDNIAKCWPLIDEKGRLYYISGSNKLTILDLNNSGKELYSKTLSNITNNQVTSIINNATIGYDSTIYLTTDKGVVALSAYPQLKIRWMYKQETNELNGTVSLSPDESKAFFINVNTQQGRSRLIVLDNMDGSLLGASDFVLGGYQNDGNYYIPPPVIQNNSTVFVLNGYDKSNKLFIFNIEATGSVSPEPRRISAGGSVNTGISQPVIDSLNAFFVFNKKLARYDATKPNFVDVFNSGESLDNASILVTNASSHIYAIDSYETSKKILGYSYSSDSGFKDDFDVSINENTKKNIALAADGTLYTVTANNLLAITPTKVSLDSLTLSRSNDIKARTVYKASKSITVNGINVKSSVNTILYSGGTISFKPGFGVSKGADLTCITGY